MKTYAEKRRRGPFDWNAFLDMAIELRIKDTPARLADKSGNWATCACGNQCEAIPRKTNGVPRDISLYTLGCHFHGHILKSDWRAAKTTLGKIEARSATLLKEIRAAKRRKAKA